MAQYLSEDLRARVIRAIEGGMSRNAAAHQFGVSVSSAVRWMAAYLATGRTAPKSRGGVLQHVATEPHLVGPPAGHITVRSTGYSTRRSSRSSAFGLAPLP